MNTAVGDEHPDNIPADDSIPRLRITVEEVNKDGSPRPEGTGKSAIQMVLELEKGYQDPMWGRFHAMLAGFEALIKHEAWKASNKVRFFAKENI